MAESKVQPLKVIALISGGKDSMFSIIHCLYQNHQIVALANLYPLPDPSSLSDATDLNSYMYQTAGHNLIPHYSSILALPLYRRAICGSAIDTSLHYVPSLANLVNHAQDETEDLTRLLQEVMTCHPEANAVCSGAILSTYQRTRVESVCVRLGLVPLAPLWQYPKLPAPSPSPGGLLDDMAKVGLEARVVKVASGGLDCECLWQNVAQGQGRKLVEKAAARFGGSVLGEGGEYETLVVAGPKGVWKGQLQVEESERVIRVGQGGEIWLAFGKGSVVLDEVETTDTATEESWRRALIVPSLWDEQFTKIQEQKTEVQTEVRNDRIDPTYQTERLESIQESWQIRQSVISSKSTISISNLVSPDEGNKIESQMASICHELKVILNGYHQSPDDILFTTILLRSMADFAQANAVYGTLFARPNPPARVTVACGNSLPRSVDVMLSCIVARGHGEHRQGLHVQSRSFWAPANIGPYSQAISLGADDTKGCLVFVAGQIPLVPISMEVLQLERQAPFEATDIIQTTEFTKSTRSPKSTKSTESTKALLFHNQALLSLQHLWRVGITMDVIWWTGAIAFIVGEEDAKDKSIIAGAIWRKIHNLSSQEDPRQETEDELDAWDRRYGSQSSYSRDGEPTRPLPDMSSLLESSTSPVPAFLAIQVSELPKGCQIEWQSLGYASSKIKVESCYIAGANGQICTALDIGAVVITLEVRWEHMESRSYINACFSALDLVDEKNGQADHSTLYTSQPAIFEAFGGQIVPCKNVWSASGLNILAGLVLRRELGDSLKCDDTEKTMILS